MVNFIKGFTIGFLIVGLYITIARTSQHNLEIYIMEEEND